MQKLNKCVLLFFLATIIFTCNKSEENNIIPLEEPEVSQINWQPANDVVVSESVLTELVNVIMIRAIQSPDLNNFTSGADDRTCPEETVVSINNDDWYPKIYTLDFGASCDVNGSAVSGIISARFSAPIAANNMNIEVIEMTDFVLNGCTVDMKDGALILAIRNGSVEGNKKFEVDTDHLCITPQDGQPINLGATWSSLVLNEMGTYFDDLGYEALEDDRFEINIMNAVYEDGGTSFTAKTITGQPLIYEFGCRWIKGGQMQIDEVVGPNDPPVETKILDYGYEGNACDNLVLVTVGDESEVVECP